MKTKKLFFFTIILIWLSMAQANEISGLIDPFGATQIKNTKTISISEKTEVYFFECLHRPAKNLQEILYKLEPEINTAIESERQQLIIKTTASRYNKILPTLKSLDSPLDNVLIEIKAIELNQNELNQYGIEWDQTPDGLKISSSTKLETFMNKLALLIGSGQGNLLANPKISALCGQEAIIKIGDKVPYTLPIESSNGKTTWQINYLESGVLLKILPEKTDPGHLILNLKPTVSSIKQWKATPAGEFPIISSREVETCLRVKNGETFALGGLLHEEERKNIQKFPVLGDIPLLGNLFTYTTMEKSKSDVVFLVTATRL